MSVWYLMLSLALFARHFDVMHSSEVAENIPQCRCDNISDMELKCPETTWYHVVSEIYTPTNNCSLLLTGQGRKKEGSDLNVNCYGRQYNKDICIESLEVHRDVVNYSNICTGVNYECIEDNVNYNLCDDVIYEIQNVVYVASPSFFNKTISDGVCRCQVTALNMTVEALYISITSSSTLDISCVQCPWSSTPFYDKTINTVLYHNKTKSTDYVVNITFHGVINDWVWIRLSGAGSLRLQCNNHLNHSTLPSTSAVLIQTSSPSITIKHESTSMTSNDSNSVTESIDESHLITEAVSITVPRGNSAHTEADVPTSLPASLKNVLTATLNTSPKAETSATLLQISGGTRVKTSSVATTATSLQNNSSLQNTTEFSTSWLASQGHVVYIIISLFVLVLIAVIIFIIIRKLREKERQENEASDEKAEVHEVCDSSHSIRNARLSVHEYSEIDISDPKAGLLFLTSDSLTRGVPHEENREITQISDSELSLEPQTLSFHEYSEIETYASQIRPKLSESEAEMHWDKETKCNEQTTRSSVVVMATRKNAERNHSKDKVCRDDFDKGVPNTDTQHVYFILESQTDDNTCSTMIETCSTVVLKENEHRGDNTDSNHKEFEECQELIYDQRDDASLSLKAKSTDSLFWGPTVEGGIEDVIPVHINKSVPVVYTVPAVTPHSIVLDDNAEALNIVNDSVRPEDFANNSGYQTTSTPPRDNQDSITTNKNNDKVMISNILYESADNVSRNTQTISIRDPNEPMMVDNVLYESGKRVSTDV